MYETFEDFLKAIQKEEITNSSFVNVETEEIGLCVDFVYVYDGMKGWVDAVPLFIEEEYGEEDVQKAIELAQSLSERFQVPYHIEINPQFIKH